MRAPERDRDAARTNCTHCADGRTNARPSTVDRRSRRLTTCDDDVDDETREDRDKEDVRVPHPASQDSWILTSRDLDV